MAAREGGRDNDNQAMAGEVGIEPTNAGIKIRCLTTWRLPSGNLAFRALRSPRARPANRFANSICKVRERMSCERPGKLSIDVRRQCRQRIAGLAFRCECGERAGTRTGHPRERADPRQRCDGLRDRGELRTGDSLEVVPAVTLGKDVYFRRRRRSCQFRCGEDRGRRHLRTRESEREPGDRQRHRRQHVADAARERRLATDEERHVGTERRARSRRAARAAGRAPTAGSTPAAPTRHRNCHPRAPPPAGCACRERSSRRSAWPRRPAVPARRAARGPLRPARRQPRAAAGSRRRRAARASRCRRDRSARTATRACGNRRHAVRSRAGTG